MKHWMVGLCYLCTSSGHCFVNKYVLTVLRFNYPTIFQGWQCLVSVIALLLFLRHSNLFTNIKKCCDVHFIPEVIFYVCCIYSGSKALARLPIPVFLGLQNLSSACLTIFKGFLFEKKPRNHAIFSLMVLCIVCTFIFNTIDPDIPSRAYFWMLVHVLSSAFCSLIDSVQSGDPVDPEGLVIVNNLFGFTSLLPCTFLFGDLQAAREYPNLYFPKFYSGVLLSGVLGAINSLLYINLVKSEEPISSSKQNQSSASYSMAVSAGLSSISGYIALSRIVASIVSQYVFEKISWSIVVWCIAASLLYPAVQSHDVIELPPDPDSKPRDSHSV